MCGAQDWMRQAAQNFKSDVSRKYLIEWMQNEDMVDVWREENPYKKTSLEDNW